MLAAVIFDFDGIIVNTEPIHYRAFQEILVPLGLGYSWEEYVNKYIGFDDRDAFRESFRAGGEPISLEDLHEMISRKAAAFNRIIAAGVEPYPGVLELIKSLKRHVPVGLCSGALRCDIEPILQQLQLVETFDVMVTADDVAASKPDPTSYRLTLKNIQRLFPDRNIKAETTIAIEDTPAGIASASGAGLHVLAVTNSYPAENLHGAIKVVQSLAGISYPEVCNFIE